MLGLLKLIIKSTLIYGMYIGGFFTMAASIFKRAEWGVFFIVGLISQPNVWYKLAELPLGNEIIDLMFISVFIGVFINKRPISKTSNLVLILLFLLFSYLSLWNSSMRYHLPLPISTDNQLVIFWKNFAMMILMYFIVINAIKNEQHQKIVILIIVLVVLAISLRSFRSFTAGTSFVDGSRAGGPFWIVGLGSNHFGAFIANYSVAILGLALFKIDKKARWFYIGTAFLSLHPLFFSYSRGAYIGAFLPLVFYGLMKKRSFLVAIFIVFISYQTLLPPSVVDRIDMTRNEATGQIESSASSRTVLWGIAFNLFNENPLFGNGTNSFWLSGRVQSTLGEDAHWGDTHNYFVETLCEGGLIGFSLLLLILLAAFRSGWKLYRTGSSPFQKGLGFGFLGCLLSLIATNMFGDRFSYVELGSFFWVLWGLVDRGIIISNEATDSIENSDKGDGTQESVIGVNENTMPNET